MNEELVTIKCDGLCEPNPCGYGCYGWVANGEQGEELAKDSGCVGSGEGITNNVAEYQAVIRALMWAYRRKKFHVRILTDSQLVVNQINGLWSCNAVTLRPLLDRVRRAQSHFDATFEWIPREQNEEADTLSKYAYKQVTGRNAPTRERREVRI